MLEIGDQVIELSTGEIKVVTAVSKDGKMFKYNDPQHPNAWSHVEYYEKIKNEEIYHKESNK